MAKVAKKCGMCGIIIRPYSPRSNIKKNKDWDKYVHHKRINDQLYYEDDVVHPKCLKKIIRLPEVDVVDEVSNTDLEQESGNEMHSEIQPIYDDVSEVRSLPSTEALVDPITFGTFVCEKDKLKKSDDAFWFYLESNENYEYSSPDSDRDDLFTPHYPCRKCSSSFQTALELALHRKKEHNRERVYRKCKQPNKPTYSLTVTTPYVGVRKITYVSPNLAKPLTGEMKAIEPVAAGHTLPAATERSLYVELERDEVLFSVDDYEGDAEDVMGIIRGKPILFEIIDASFQRMMFQFDNANCLSANYLRVTRKNDKNQEIDFRVSSDCRPKFKINEDTVLVVPLSAFNHLYVAIFECKHRVVHVYDSSWEYSELPDYVRKKHVEKIIINVMPTNLRDTDKWKGLLHKDSSRQCDQVSCGYFCLYFVKNHLEKVWVATSRNLDKKYVKILREGVVTELLSTTTKGCELLEALKW